ncbi:MAG: AAA family ATPase [Bacteroidales bacterium]|nr:AAA family ATPase [Bacteroidales bacterium]
MIHRDLLQHLQNWKDKEDRKPLVLRGARQVGKSTAVDIFSQSYPNYLKYNLDEDEDRAILERDLSLDDRINIMFANRLIRKKEGETLIFLDEIQNSPKTINLLRYFKEKRPDIHVIAAGSLLENTVDIKASFPVGRVEYMAMHPCSFHEFMGALGYEEWEYFINNPELSGANHQSMMSLFNQYVVVGGMPEVVAKYSKTKDIIALDDLYISLLQGYLDDVEKYARRGKLTEVIKFIIKNSWYKAGEKVTLTRFAGSEYKSREVSEAFQMLQKAFLLELVYPTTATIVPALPEMGRKPKLIMLDTGMANFQAGVRKEIIGAKDILDLWRGRIAEQVVGQELLTLTSKVGQNRIFWTKGKDVAELDFIYPYDGKIIPIEVKNGHNSKLGSLHTFMDATNHDFAIRVWSQPFSIDDVVTTNGRKPFRLVNLPFYLVQKLPAIIDKYI